MNEKELPLVKFKFDLIENKEIIIEITLDNLTEQNIKA